MFYKDIDVALIRRPKNGAYTWGYKFEYKKKKYGYYITTDSETVPSELTEHGQNLIDRLVEGE